MSIAIGSDMVVNLYGLYDIVTDSFVNDATVNGALLDADGNSVTTFSMPYVLNTNGEYRGAISSGVTSGLTEGDDYTVQVTANFGGIILIDRDIHAALPL